MSHPPIPTRRSFGEGLIELRRGDLTAESTDAIVNAANGQLAPGAGVCGAIRRAGGDSIFEECAAIVKERGPLAPGAAVLTGGGRLPARHVIHAVGPFWRGGKDGEALALASCYHQSLDLARSRGLSSIAFPSISTGIYGYPVALAAAVALSTVRAWLLLPPGGAHEPSLSLVRFVLWSEEDLAAYGAELERLPN
ncbi:MAG TPA: macro domain-containing protein [Vicinamibacteria bacterium]